MSHLLRVFALSLLFQVFSTFPMLPLCAVSNRRFTCWTSCVIANLANLQVVSQPKSLPSSRLIQSMLQPKSSHTRQLDEVLEVKLHVLQVCPIQVKACQACSICLLAKEFCQQASLLLHLSAVGLARHARHAAKSTRSQLACIARLLQLQPMKPKTRA